MAILKVIIALAVSILLTITSWTVWAHDVDFPVIRHYPPGYYGSGYYSQSFFPQPSPLGGKDPFKWDKFMSRELGIEFPFHPIPYTWDYGTGLTFNFPDLNANNWP